MAGSSTSVVSQSKEETLKTWVGDTRPTFPGENPASLFGNAGNPQNGATLQLSPEGRAALEQQQAAATAGSTGESNDGYPELSDKDKQKLYLLQKFIEALTGKRFKFVLPKSIKLNTSIEELEARRQQAVQLQTPQLQPVQLRQGWGLEYDLHEAHYEKQTMSFSAEGSVKTADGKEIRFDLDLNMSREFASRTDVSIRAGDAVKVDPLVVNFGGASAALTNNKFNFDIDNDGDEDQISFATGGSGFLAFDVNGDGTINNGSELFGPQSGNGFSDLAQYDGDRNGWIDENDDIYSKLRIWTKDESGSDQLFALGTKGIGAIYLGNVSTGYDVKTFGNDTLGSIARTGVFLRENGVAGTIQHVDLVI
jgi:hypothetical protein